MIFRLLLWVLAVLGFMWFWRRLQGAALQQRPRRSPDAAGGHMVRDRVCQTFLPEGDALRLVEDGKTLFFCSTACRDRHLQGKARA